MIIAATGHRPDKLGGYNSPKVTKTLRLIARDYLKNHPTIEQGISGLALGWDQAWALELLEAKIPLIAAIPCDGQDFLWSPEQRHVYHDILSQAKKVEYVNRGKYENWKMQARNEWMVERCDRLVAMWNGSKGGTSNCISYARYKPVDNLWSSYQAAMGTRSGFFD